MSNNLDHIAETILSKVNVNTSNRLVVGIGGGPGSGKSTFAVKLKELINSKAKVDLVQIFPMDGFHRKNIELERHGLLSVKGTPETFDLEGYRSMLNRIKLGENLKAPIYSREDHDVINNALPIEPHHKIIITEGNYLFADMEGWCEIKDIIDLKIYIEAEKGACEKRLLERHMRGGKTEAEALEKIKMVDMENYDLIDQTKKYADKIIK
ncbi:MAG: Pantothenate kinase [Candidatus Scalindua arabica]|uniref:Pantothenate kinase n=1 Tax=Candidatus Scalindua arabica TaxID=1127984 RepID=A0A942A0I7_9BACT|nr:Pantothenate kinase [Candidatus Scalindua arabica]